MDLIYEGHEGCFGFLRAVRCKIGQDGIWLIEKMNVIRLCATSVKPVFSSWASLAGVCCEHVP